MQAIIREIYRKTSAEVQVNGTVTEEFDTENGVRQGCALSALLFDIFIDDLDDEWIKRMEGGTVIGNMKIRALKYADDIAVVAESASELEKVLRTLERYMEKNKLIINTQKSKVMIFRNGGKSGKGEEWKLNGEKVEVEKEFRYLGYTFTTKNGTERHVECMAGKAEKAANAAWGIMKRAGRETRKERVYMMNTLVRSVAMYGVEIWGWGKFERMNRVQGRYAKMALGVARNTPKYIWRNELGIVGIEYTCKERAIRYLCEILAMRKERWPRICLMEEMRATLNSKPSKWGRQVMEVMKEIGRDDIYNMIRAEGKEEDVLESMKKGLNEWWEREKGKEWVKIVESSYNKIYKYIAPGQEGAGYLNKRGKIRENKEIWARLRCGNYGRGQKKGYKEWECRLCRGGEETLADQFCRSEAESLQSKETRTIISEWRGDKREWEMEELLIELLKGEVKDEICEYIRKIEDKIKSNTGVT